MQTGWSACGHHPNLPPAGTLSPGPVCGTQPAVPPVQIYGTEGLCFPLFPPYLPCWVLVGGATLVLVGGDCVSCPPRQHRWQRGSRHWERPSSGSCWESPGTWVGVWGASQPRGVV